MSIDHDESSNQRVEQNRRPAWQFRTCTGNSNRRSTTWRWVLIVSELILGSYLMAVLAVGADLRQATWPFLAVGVLASVAWGFLFLAAPLLVRSQGLLAVLGWCIAVSAFLMPVL